MVDGAQNVLPRLGDKRLALASKQSHRIRKMTSIMNQKLTHKTEIYGKALEKDSKNFEYKMWQKSMSIKDQLLQIRSTKRCLKKQRESVLEENADDKKYGVYDGLSLRDLRYDIDLLLKGSNPRARRLKKVERLLNDGKKDGRLLDYDAAKESLEIIVTRPFLPPITETGHGLHIRATNAHVTKGINTSSGLHLPPINISIENTKKRNDKMKSRSTLAVERIKFGNGTKLEMEHILKS